ncbi:hypothetical protein ACI68E_003714 [Malassezia pachydermatis]|uniref:NADAR domain-containing protein n=1 Tax=Malassezia pachydermatis TaxID=77020 RepID=A0A0M8MKF2_9BASI|nr:hypothetical protein Malapachy_0252 [Malassezia pachydermatis]KOS13338.1 hypothetical protein Malapachy_0252 [Malassezia pachydermatis]
MQKSLGKLLNRTQKRPSTVDADLSSSIMSDVPAVTPGGSRFVSPTGSPPRTPASFIPTGESNVISAAVQESISHGKSAKENKIEFFSKDIPFFWLSNSSDHPVVVDGVRYPTAEHLFQAQKFVEHRPDLASKVRKASTPIEAIHVARMNSQYVRPDWIKGGVNVSTMRMVLLTKFMQHTDLRQALLETGDAEIVHASPNDAFWGSAAPVEAVGRGRNMLGRTIMQTRELLRVAAGVGANSGTRTV